MRQALLVVFTLLATCNYILSAVGDSLSVKNHDDQRRAMLQALSDSDSTSTFTSPQEQRSHYYIHEGLRSAVERSLRMANFDVDLLWDYLDDDITSEGDEDLEMAYSQFLDEVLTDMIDEVENALQKITTNKDGATSTVTTSTGGETETDHETGNDAAEQNSNKASGGDDYIDPATAILTAFDKLHDDLHCDNYNNVTLDDPLLKWNYMKQAYWAFFNLDPPNELYPPPFEDDDYSKVFYTTEGNVYFDFLRSGDVQIPLMPKRTAQQRGMFAARDFERDELVYSFMANGLFFLDLSTFERFIHNSTLLTEHDACLLVKWSFAQKLTRPGRYYICSSADEGAFFNGGKDGRVNVYLEDSRDLKYYARRKIAKGEEIIYFSP